MRLAASFAAVVSIGLCLHAGIALGQETSLGAPQPERSVRDPEFGVVARHFGLERRVQMLQWQHVPQGYVRVWSEQPIDSGAFAAERQNPPRIPLRNRRWFATQVSVDGKPLDPEVIAALGRWQPFRPSFSALPGNLAATFQPEGDGLGSAENPLDPRIGDLRVHWRELVLPPLDGRIVLRGGRWRLLPRQPAAAGAGTGDTMDGAAPPSDSTAAVGRPSHRAWWLAAAIAACIAVLAALIVRRRRFHR